ncbi:bifunctional MaoC family dehydratase N-terminal/OB-fold nucleic acid binding domain-containing protein [Rhodococcoides yunnanense]|uniref:bifunctional MaoC family dehydratase N-terminal/OB-fold nucleic acid binding domain-containing protein n=1 Tax=Rhodococcoides yunnanense TaxID=278209 RepID=UPI0022B08CD3|nr:MaoC family dehydratase N-terminal domain-containing protein [Rhodococcus yunnanensis]MCZ4276897.1 MaoC family dehydratase N-terminal domain-containing protein [Rhodococcus yunnanensis]
MSETIAEAADRIAAQGESARRAGRDPVNQPMINNWVEAIGDANPIYVDDAAAREAGHEGVVAPPAMAQVWTMGGLHRTRSADDPLGQIMAILDEAGFTSIVATSCEQTYHRYLRVGEEVTLTARLENVVGPKKTGLGHGWFVTTRNIWYVGEEPAAEMLFRVLKFAPNVSSVAAEIPEQIRPVVSQETEFFWDGTKVGELRVQRVEDGSLRHPPIPAIWQDRDKPLDYVVASGRGTVFSYVVHHAPAVPGRSLPFVIALVELEEGVRMLGELRGIEPEEVAIGLPVEVDFVRIDEDLTLPAWKAVG